MQLRCQAFIMETVDCFMYYYLEVYFFCPSNCVNTGDQSLCNGDLATAEISWNINVWPATLFQD